MFLTMESARLPWLATTFSKIRALIIPVNSFATSSLAPFSVERGSAAASMSSSQLVEKVSRQLGEVVDEVQRVLDLVGDAGGELAQRRELLGLHAGGPARYAAQVGKRTRSSSRVRACTSLEQARTFSMAITA